MAAHSRRNGKARRLLTVSAMAREISAGGVVLREISGVWHVALIEPQKEDSEPVKDLAKPGRSVLTLPKGLVDAGEKPQDAAIREVYEETGIRAEAGYQARGHQVRLHSELGRWSARFQDRELLSDALLVGGNRPPC